MHVSNILTKLAMGSRTEVATWAVRSGLVPRARETADSVTGQQAA